VTLVGCPKVTLPTGDLEEVCTVSKWAFWPVFVLLMAAYVAGVGGVWPIVGFVVLLLVELLVFRRASPSASDKWWPPLSTRDVVLLVAGVVLLVMYVLGVSGWISRS
jgi:hypothetical protein